MFADLLLDTYIGTHQVITKDVYAFVQSLDPQLIWVWPPLLPPSACLSFIKLVPISQPHVISLLINKPSPMDCVQRQYLKRQFKHQGIKTDIDFRDCSNIDCKKKPRDTQQVLHSFFNWSQMTRKKCILTWMFVLDGYRKYS